MAPLSFTRRSALRLIAAAFAFRPKIGLSLFEDTNEVNDVHSAVLEHAQKQFEEEHEREKANFKRLVVAGETACMCWPTYRVSFQPWDPAEVAEHARLQHQFQPRFTVSKPYVVRFSPLRMKIGELTLTSIGSSRRNIPAAAEPPFS
jgi:hypothetical protein